MKIEILSVGCAKCNKLVDTVRDLVNDQQIDAEVIKVEDMKVFCNYGVFMLPALVVDGEVKIAGKLPTQSELMAWLSVPK